VTLSEIASIISKGLPFKREVWPSKIYYFYDTNEQWFIQVNTETGCEIITFTLDLKLEDIEATDWTIDEWDNDVVVESS
jgi:hypothetical protein